MTAPSGGGQVVVLDPATGQEVARYASFGEREVEEALATAVEQQARWRLVPLEERTAVLRTAGAGLRERAAELSALITREMGKPLAQALAEIEKCAWNCDYYADNAEAILADEPVVSGASRSWISYEPVGVVLAVMPWNFPFWQVFRFAAPALAAGNGVLLKHSPNVTGCALAVEDVLVRAGAPAGLFRTLVVDEPAVPAVTAGLISDPRIAAVTLTGSERAGVAVGRAAGAALKKTVLELGGSDPFVVLADADVAAAASVGVASRFLNAGQSCIAAKRFIVHTDVAEEFERLFAEAAAALTVGDPFDPETGIGPMARGDLLDQVDDQVHASVRAGARLLLGGARLEREGFFYPPTVLADVTAEMPVFASETFGPVAALVRAQDDDHAVALANDSRYGLGASVWSKDHEHALRVGRRIQSGALFVNGMVASDPRLPFGGTKASGHGRELSAVGLREFTNIRTVWLGPAEGGAVAASE